MSQPGQDKQPTEMPEGYNDTGIPVEDEDETAKWYPHFTEEEMAESVRKTMEWWRQKQERAKKEPRA